jgi:flagellar capping protein FliD
MIQMSGDKEKIDQLAEKIEELLSVLKDLSEDLKTVSASLKSLAVSQITSKPSASLTPKSTISAPRPAASPSATRSSVPIPAAASAAQAKTQNIEDVRMMFPEDLDNMLAFEDKGDYIMIKPKQFLGSENFAKIASTVRGTGGEYISAGRESHFRVYKKKG